MGTLYQNAGRFVWWQVEVQGKFRWIGADSEPEDTIAGVSRRVITHEERDHDTVHLSPEQMAKLIEVGPTSQIYSCHWCSGSVVNPDIMMKFCPHCGREAKNDRIRNGTNYVQPLRRRRA